MFTITAIALFVLVAPVSAAVITFDDPVGNSILYSYPAAFSDGGLTFTNKGTYMSVWGASSPNSNLTNNLIFAGFSSGDLMSITKTGGGSFDLNSLDMSLSWYDSYSSETILINGTPITLGQGIQNYVLNLQGVTQVDITGVPSNSGYWLMDNVNTGSAVPEPTSLLLFGTGLSGIGLAAWRRRK